MKSVKLWIFLFILLSIAIIVGFLFVANTRWARIEDYNIDGVESCSVKRIITPVFFESFLLMDRGAIKRDLESLAYIDKAYFSYSDNMLSIKLSNEEDGIVIMGGDIALFYDGEAFLDIDIRDVRTLKEIYILLNADYEYLLYMKRYGFSDDFIRIVDYLYNMDRSEILITNAGFEHNGNGNSKLRLYLDNLNSTLLVSDLSKLDFLKDILEYISDDIIDQRYDTIFSGRLYELRSSGLVRVKR